VCHPLPQVYPCPHIFPVFLLITSLVLPSQNGTPAITPAIAETTTSPALDAAESGPFDSVPVVPAKEQPTPAAESSVVKSALDADAAPALAISGMERLLLRSRVK
jgi:hypothetical protein